MMGARSVWLPPALLYCAAFVLLLGWSHQRTIADREAEFARLTGEVTERLESSVDTLQAVAASVLGAHYSSPEFGPEELAIVASRLQERSPEVVAVGQVDIVRPQERRNFESAMVELGFPHFHINTLETDGAVVPAADAPYLYPVSSLEPLSPDNLIMVGQVSA